MKKISMCLLVFMCLFTLTINQSAAQDTATDMTDTPAINSATSDMPAADQDVAAPEESEGEISYTADAESTAPLPSSDIEVVEARICEGINDREPVAPGDVFPSDISSLFCFSRIKSAENTEIKHIWYFNGQPVAEIPLSIGVSSGWRTFSSKAIDPIDKGNWKVEIVTASGTPVRTIQFIIN